MTQPLRERITGNTNAGTAVDISIPQIKPGSVGKITHIALANHSGESVTVQFGITSLGNFEPFWALQTVADADAFGAYVWFNLLEGDKLTARVKGTAKSSTVTFIVSGILEDSTPELIAVTEVAQ